MLSKGSKMSESKVVLELRKKGADVEGIVGMVLKRPGYIGDLIEVIETEKGAVKFGCEKVLRLVSEQKPEVVYPYFDFFVELMGSDNSFLKWGAILTVANLASVDSEGKFEEIFEKYYAPIKGPVMVTAANVIGGSAKIAMAKPGLAERIVKEILKVEKCKYYHKGELSGECRNVACGAAIETFDVIYDIIEDKQVVNRFVKRQLKNPRAKVAKKAEKFLKKYGTTD